MYPFRQLMREIPTLLFQYFSPAFSRCVVSIAIFLLDSVEAKKSFPSAGWLRNLLKWNRLPFDLSGIGIDCPDPICPTKVFHPAQLWRVDQTGKLPFEFTGGKCFCFG